MASAEQYESRLRLLAERLRTPLQPLTWLDNTAKVTRAVDMLAKSSRYPTLAAAAAARPGRAAIYMREAVARRAPPTEKKTARQRAGWLAPRVLAGAVAQFAAAALARNATPAAIQDGALVLAYTELPPVRNDWASVSFTGKTDPGTGNTLTVTPAGFTVTWRKFKTAGAWKGPPPTTVIKKTSRLYKVLARLLRARGPPPTPVFLTARGRPQTNHQLGAALRALFKRATGKAVGSQLLRTIDATTHAGDGARALLARARAQQHSLSTHIETYTKT